MILQRAKNRGLQLDACLFLALPPRAQAGRRSSQADSGPKHTRLHHVCQCCVIDQLQKSVHGQSCPLTQIMLNNTAGCTELHKITTQVVVVRDWRYTHTLKRIMKHPPSTGARQTPAGHAGELPQHKAICNSNTPNKHVCAALRHGTEAYAATYARRMRLLGRTTSPTQGMPQRRGRRHKSAE